MECRRNRSDTRFHIQRFWDLWPLPLQQLDQDWDDVHVDEFPEVSNSFARRGDTRWDALYTVFTKHWLTDSSPHMKTALEIPDISRSGSPVPVCPNSAEQLHCALLALSRRAAREPSLDRRFPRRKRTPPKPDAEWAKELL